jgi:hypothetical protein
MCRVGMCCILLSPGIGARIPQCIFLPHNVSPGSEKIGKAS